MPEISGKEIVDKNDIFYYEKTGKFNNRAVIIQDRNVNILIRRSLKGEISFVSCPSTFDNTRKSMIEVPLFKISSRETAGNVSLSEKTSRQRPGHTVL